MKISYNWLCEYVNIELDAYKLAEKLTLHGLEVDKVEETGSSFDGVVVGHITGVRPHTNADRLQLCDVDLGDGHDPVQIVCGAPNVKSGQKVPVATVGAELPVELDDGSRLVIKKTKLRGESSNGMICAEDELGIGTDHSGIMVLDPSLKPGTPFAKVVPPTKDYIIDIELTPNRPDATCHIGVARDVAAFTNQTLKIPDVKIPPGTSGPDDDIEIQIENPKKCHRYVGMVIKGAHIGESPQWLKTRLEAIGVRPVNAVVDSTNFVLHEMGQPLHAFDLDTIADKKIIVKDFNKPITFETLDHVEREVPAGTLFICDGKEPVALAGIMGGLDSEINNNTQNILLESAYFSPASIRRSAKQLGLQTDASYRFERGIDPNITLKAASRCARLIAELTGGELPERHKDIHPVRTDPTELSLRLSYINRLLGTSLAINDVADILERLEITITKKNDEKLTATVPTFRPDLKREVDLIEEVGRIYDYNNIPVPQSFAVSELKPVNDDEKLNNTVKNLLKSHGFKEIYTNSLLSEEDALLYEDKERIIHTLNPISIDQAVLRTSLLHGFLKVVSYNEKRGQQNLRFFETGHVFRRSDNGTYFEGYEEKIHFSLGLAGYKHNVHWLTEVNEYDIFDLKAHLQPLMEQLSIDQEISTELVNAHTLNYEIGDTWFGHLLRVSPDMLENYDIRIPVYFAEFSFSALLNNWRTEAKDTTYKPVPKFPTFDFDLALIVSRSVPAGALIDNIKKVAGEQLKSIDIFDVFEGKSVGTDQKSIAFRLKFLDTEKTLTINDVQPKIDNILKELNKKYNAELRSK